MVLLGDLMPKKIKLTPAEWEIMNTIWDLGGNPSVREVLEKRFPNGEKAYTTIQAFMNILEKKNVLRRKKIGLVNFYTPLYKRDEVVRDEMSNVLSQVFNGSVTALASALLSMDNVTIEEIDDLKRIINEKEKDLSGKNG
jgi:BlaI family penicillinase repressor